MKRIKNEGALGSKDFEATGTKKANGWWNWKPSKIALELLYWQGKLMVSERINFHRKYDLTERVLPPDTNTKLPSSKEQVEFWITKALESYGIATLSDIKKHIHHSDNKAIEKHLPKLITQSEIIEIEVSGLKDSYYALTEQFENSYPIKKHTDKLHILSPFDNAVILRDRIQKLFDFKYTIECYVPKPKRIYGYFVLPILYGDKLIGRLDAKADRKAKKLIIHNIYLEKDYLPSNKFIILLSEKIQSFAKYNNCNSITLSKTVPSSLKQELTKQL